MAQTFFGTPNRTYQPYWYTDPPGASSTYTLNANAGTYALAGVAAVVVAAHVLASAAGVYAVSGVSATETLARGVPAASGSYAVSGVATTETAARSLSLASGNYSISGVAGTLAYGRLAPVDAGAYAVTGVAADLSQTHAGKQLDADSGIYAVGGIDAAVTTARELALDAGSYAVTGVVADLSVATAEVDFSGACTVSRPTCAGTLTAFHILEPQGGLGGKPRPGDFAHAATKADTPTAPAAWRASGHAGVARPRAAGHLWAQPVTAFAGARLAPRRAPLGHGGFTHDDRPIFEDEGFLLGLLLADDED